jgi:hypothetical protein
MQDLAWCVVLLFSPSRRPLKRPPSPTVPQNDQQAVKVNALGKWKTALQMTAMSILLFCRDTKTMPAVWTGEVI